MLLSASRPCRFTPRDGALGMYWIEGREGHQEGQKDVEQWKFLTLTGLEHQLL
jgi:hypothetical protein